MKCWHPSSLLFDICIAKLILNFSGKECHICIQNTRNFYFPDALKLCFPFCRPISVHYSKKYIQQHIRLFNIMKFSQ
jgi:hypothetical protein